LATKYNPIQLFAESLQKIFMLIENSVKSGRTCSNILKKTNNRQAQEPGKNPERNTLAGRKEKKKKKQRKKIACKPLSQVKY